MLHLGGVEDGDGVAVVDAHDAASEGGSIDAARNEGEKDAIKKAHGYMLT